MKDTLFLSSTTNARIGISVFKDKVPKLWLVLASQGRYDLSQGGTANTITVNTGQKTFKMKQSVRPQRQDGHCHSEGEEIWGRIP